MKKIVCVLFLMLVLLCACSTAQQEQPVTVPTTPTVPTEPPTADLGGVKVELGASSLNLAGEVFDLDLLISAAPKLEQLVHIDLGQTELSGTQIKQLEDAYPNAEIDYSLSFLGQTLTRDTVGIDASTMSVEQTDELLDLIPILPLLKEIIFVSEDGSCVYGIEDISELDRIRQAFPDLYLRVRFDLFGQTVTSEDQRIEYYLVDIGNEGVDTVRAVLPYLRSCVYFLMDGCGIDYEILAQMRDDFPETEIVWRVWLIPENYNSPKAMRGASLLTDTHRVRTIHVRDENAHLLNYCTKTKYLDIGHIPSLTTCEFLRYMPDLEVCILAITGIVDISPLENHEKLEYLELFTSDIYDLTPLASCPNIEHLNISNMQYLRDLSPLYGLKKMKRLRMVRNASLSYEEKNKLMEQLPDCEFLNRGEWPTTGTWRWVDATRTERVERYALLCEQMEYAIDYQVYGID